MWRAGRLKWRVEREIGHFCLAFVMFGDPGARLEYTGKFAWDFWEYGSKIWTGSGDCAECYFSPHLAVVGRGGPLGRGGAVSRPPLLFCPFWPVLWKSCSDRGSGASFGNGGCFEGPFPETLDLGVFLSSFPAPEPPTAAPSREMRTKTPSCPREEGTLFLDYILDFILCSFPAPEPPQAGK